MAGRTPSTVSAIGRVDTTFHMDAALDWDILPDTFGSGFDTVLRVMDTDCSTELFCDDDGIEWITYESGSLDSMVEATLIEGETVVLVVDNLFIGYPGLRLRPQRRRGRMPRPRCGLRDGGWYRRSLRLRRACAAPTPAAMAHATRGCSATSLN